MRHYRNHCFTLVWALLFLALFSTVSLAGTVYVKTTGNDANDGSSWDLAKKTVQAGINAAVSGDEVWVAAGTYAEWVAHKSGVKLYGGYSGSGTTRDVAVYVTTIDAYGLSHSAVTIPAGATSATAVDGFTIMRGYANYGGGIYVQGSPVISHNTISSNTASGSATGKGGGIYCTSGSPQIASNVIISNIASATWYATGGGIYCESTSHATIINNAIYGNAGDGIASCGFLTIINNSLIGNTGSGIILSGSGDAVVNNICTLNNGGVYAYSTPPPASAVRNNCAYDNGPAGSYPGWTTDPTGTNGNTSADPQIAYVMHKGTHLSPTSPCIGAGDNSVVQPDWTDIDGQVRILPAGGAVDIGADESDGTTPAGSVRVVRVSPTGNDANDGSDWDDAHAKKTIQSAVNSVRSAGGEVWVKAGTYNENVVMYSYVYLYGGFDGTEVSRNERDWRANVTIIDGQHSSSVVNITGGHVFSAVGGFTIRNGKTTYGGGVFIQNASPTLTYNIICGNSGSRAGGGIYCEGGRPVIAENAIAGNAGQEGGGIYATGSKAEIANNTIVGNSAYSGGGIWTNDATSGLRVANNIVAWNAGGMYKTSAANGVLTFKNNCVYGNDGRDYTGWTTPPTGTNGNIAGDPKVSGWAYGGFHIAADSPCINAGDNASVRPGYLDLDCEPRVQPGGAVVDIGADEFNGSTPSFNVRVFRVTPTGSDSNDGSAWDNAHAKQTIQAAVDAACGGGGEVWVKAGTYYGTLDLKGTVHVYGGFNGTETSKSQRNRVLNPTVIDGLSFSGSGAIASSQTGYRTSTLDSFVTRNIAYVSCYYGSPVISNNLITGCTSVNYDVGAVYCYWSSPLVVNNVIASNMNSGVTCQSSYATVTNNTVVGNRQHGLFSKNAAPTFANNIVAYNANSGIVRDANYTATPVVHHNCSFGNANYNYRYVTPGTGGLEVDPVLVDYASGNMHIRPGSPCRNSGDDAVVQDVALDFESQARRQGVVDIGADESDGAAWISGPPVIVRVAPTGSDTNDGSGWDAAHAKRTVQAGIDAASASGGEVWVRAGTYNGSITLSQFVYLYGGFGGAETYRSGRNWRTNPTILDGQATSTVVSGGGGYKYSCIDGFTIGNGIGYLISNGRCGGGVFLYYSSHSVSNCTISNNASSGSNYGGGVYCYYSDSRISGNTITGNTSGYGGGIYCDYGMPTITGNTITGNTMTSTSTGGSGIQLNGDGYVHNCVVANNTGGANTSGICGNASRTMYAINNVVIGHNRGIQNFYRARNNIVAYNTTGMYGSGSTRSNNCVYGNTTNYGGGQTAGSGDINLDPLFMNYAGGDYHLQATSPCVDRGISTDAPITDYEGVPRPQDGDGNGSAVTDIGAYETVINGSIAKKQCPDGATFTLSGYSVTGTIPGANCLYVENHDRYIGFRVDSSNSFTEGDKVNVYGTIQTDAATRERYVQPGSGYPASAGGSDLLDPLALTSRDLGGEANGLQAGVATGSGVNNIGLLVSTWGSVVEFDNPDAPVSWFKISDGSTWSLDGSQIAVKVKAPTGVTINKRWQWVLVTGISSCEKDELGNIQRVIKVRRQSDIVPIITAP